MGIIAHKLPAIDHPLATGQLVCSHCKGIAETNKEFKSKQILAYPLAATNRILPEFYESHPDTNSGWLFIP